MKRIISAVLLVLIMSTATFAKTAVAKGKTHTDLGNYRIEKSDKRVQVNGQDCKTFRITYANSPVEVTLVVLKDGAERKYLALSDKLSIQYSWNQNCFGVSRIDENLGEQGFRTKDEYLNRAEYYHQRVIGPGMLMDRESAMLIAAYYPFLLAPEATMIASK